MNIDWSGMITAEQQAHQAAKALLAGRITANINAYNAATMALTADYPQLEKDTWPTQNEEATAWVADPAGAATPWIDRAAAERGIDRDEYIRRTLIKARQFKVMSAFLTGRRQKYEDQIKAGNDPVLDYALTPEVLAELQQITETIMSTPAAGLQEALA
jgi:type II secretory pathway pseudopilin PulG